MSDLPAENKASKRYPTERGSQAFFPIDVARQRDADREATRIHAEFELERIREVVDLLRKQALDIIYRMEVAEWVRLAKFEFVPVVLKVYYLYYDEWKGHMILRHTAPGESINYQHLSFVSAVRVLPDRTWETVKEM